MKISEIKKEMIEFRDFFGQDLISFSEIEKCKTRKQLAKLIQEHDCHLEAIISDAQSHLGRFKEKLGLHII